MNLKQQLLKEIGEDLSSSRNPTKQAIDLVHKAELQQEKFKNAIKKPTPEASKRVSFAQNIENTKNERDKPQKHHQPQNERNLNVSSEQQYVFQKCEHHKDNHQLSEKKNRNYSQEKIKREPKEQLQTKIRQQTTQPKTREQNTQQKIRDVNTQPQIREQTQPQVREQNQSQIRESQLSQTREQFSQQRIKEHKESNYEDDLIQQNIELRQQIQKSETKQQIEQLKQQIEILTNHNNNLKTSYDKTQQQLMESQNKSQQQIEELNKQVWNLKTELQDAHFQLAQASHEQELTKKQFQDLENEFESEQLRRTKIERVLHDTNAQNDQLQFSMLDNQGISKRLELLNSQLTQDLQQSKTAAQRAQEESRRLIGQVVELENEKTRLTAQLSSLRSERQDSNKLDSLQAENVQLKTEIDRNHRQSDSIKQERDQWKSDYDILRVKLMEMEEMRYKLKVKESEIEMLQVDNDKLKWKIRKDPNGVLSDLKNTNIEIQENTQVSSVKQNDMLNEIQKLDKKNRQIEDDYNKIRSENTRLQNELQQMDIYVVDIRSLFERERVYLEDRIHQLQKQSYSTIPQTTIKSIQADQGISNQQKRVTFESFQSPYQLPQLTSIK